MGYLNEVDGKLCHLVSRVRANPLAKWPYLDETTTISIRLDDKYLDDRANMYFQSVYLYIPIYIYVYACMEHVSNTKSFLILKKHDRYVVFGRGFMEKIRWHFTISAVIDHDGRGKLTKAEYNAGMLTNIPAFGTDRI